MTRKYFGTDGIRGEVGKGSITPEFVLKLGWAAGRVLSPGGGGKVLIGKDTRISGYMFESVLEAGLSAAGVDVLLLGPMPTPGIAYLTRTFHARAGIVISASHNAFQDNGIKFFGPDGLKLLDETELKIEHEMDQPLETVSSESLGKASRVDDAAGRYIEFCKATIPKTVSLQGLRVVIDCANGATYHVAPSVLRELGAKVVCIGVDPDGLNINRDVGSTPPEALQAAMKEHRATVGVALDGDGDRLIMVDDHGEIVDGDELLYIIARARHDAGMLHGGVVGTVMTNLGMEQALARDGIEFARSKVGDRYVLEMMAQRGWLIGGEGSGHIICKDRTTTGDGMVSALQVLAAMVQSGKSLHELKQGMSKFPQIMRNVRVAAGATPATHPLVIEAVNDAEVTLAGHGRVLIRASGTEPVVRVMVEGEDGTLVARLVDELAEVVANTAD